VRRFAIGCLAIIGGVALLVFVLMGVGIYKLVHNQQAMAPSATIEAKSLVRLDLSGTLGEGGKNDPIQIALSSGAPNLRDIVDTLERAAGDERVRGVIADLGHTQLSLASAQEISAALKRFRATGKHAVAYADTLAETGSNSQTLLLASAFEEIWLQPAGEVGANGLGLELPFIADTLKMIGVTPRFGQRYEFKGGIDTYTETALPAPLKESLGKLVDDLYGQIVQGVADGRKLKEAEVKQLIDHAPLSADDALAGKLVDHLGYRRDAERALEKASETNNFVDGGDYLESAGRPNRDGAHIAAIYGVGQVVRGNPDDGLFSDGAQMSAVEVERAFRQAARDPDVKAIVFRINSPGGSYVASDTIWQAVHEARKAGKKVIASMGNLAASGGYFSAIACDRIIAEPGTLTGSIGVYSGKFVLSGLWQKLGVNWAQVSAGAHAGQDSANRDFTPEEWAEFQRGLDRIYADFTKRVATDRNISQGDMDLVARGRVWSGAAAKSLGLVDELGDFHAAVIEAKKAAGLAEDAPIELVTFPRQEQPFQKFAKLLKKMNRTEVSLDRLEQAEKILSPVIGALAPGQPDSELLSPLASAPVR
jgi:protease-4